MVWQILAGGAVTALGSLVGSKKSSGMGQTGGSSIGSGLVEVGTKKDVTNQSTQTTSSTMSTYSPQSSYVNTPTWTYSPTYVLNSAGADVTGSNTTGSTTPLSYFVSPNQTTIPTTTQGSGTGTPSSTLSNLTDNVSTLAIMGAIGLGAYLLLKKKKWLIMGIEDTTIPKTYTGDGTTIDITGTTISAIDPSKLGEIKMFALSVTNAVTKVILNGKGWAICDGTDTATQVTSPTITGNTPDLRNKFLRGSANETTGTEAGADTHVHTLKHDGVANQSTTGFTNAEFAFTTTGTGNSLARTTADITGAVLSSSNIPANYTICFFMKVK